jgi:hypothetical protein
MDQPPAAARTGTEAWHRRLHHTGHPVVVLARSTQEGIVVNLPSLRVEVPELDRLIADPSGAEAGR